MNEETLREQIELERKNIAKYREAIANSENRLSGLTEELRKISGIPQVGEFRICVYTPGNGPLVTYIAQLDGVRENQGVAIVTIVHCDNPSGPVYAGRTEWIVSFDEIGAPAVQVWRAKE